MTDIFEELEKQARFLKYMDYRRAEEYFDQTFGETKYAQVMEGDQMGVGVDAIQYPEVQPPQEEAMAAPPPIDMPTAPADLQQAMEGMGAPAPIEAPPMPTTAEDIGNFQVDTGMPDMKDPTAPKLTDTGAFGAQ